MSREKAVPASSDALPTAIKGPDGKTVFIKDLPLVAYRLNCGHLGKNYGIRRWDILFCDDCGADKRVKTILAS